MSRTLRILRRAQDDVDVIFNWLSRRSVRGAIAWYMAFRHALGLIAQAPESFPEAPESRVLSGQLHQGLFKTRRGRVYRIVFTLSVTEVIVLRVRGPGQSPLRPRDLSGE
jgi:plasmid stabilization system protein ParE